MAANSQFSMAVHTLTMLARANGQNLKSEQLASSVNTNAVVIRRLLADLGRAGLVASNTGAFGGTRLAREAGDIRLVDIYKAVACGEVFALHPKSPNQDCPVGRRIESILCHLQREIDHAVAGKLSEYTLADVIEKMGQL